jgi:hypothetical protein
MRVITFFICLLPLLGNGQIIWNKIDSTDIGNVEGSQTFVIDSSFYIVSGRKVSFDPTKAVWEYQITSNTWRRKQDFDSIFAGGGAAYGHYGYVVSGQVQSQNQHIPTSQCWSYSPVSNSWSSIAPIPESRFYGCTYSYVGSIYTCLGWDSNYHFLNTNWSYDINTNQWHQRVSKPGGRS